MNSVPGANLREMCLRIVLWAGILGFSGGFGGMVLGEKMAPADYRAPAFGMIGGAILGSAIGAGAVALFGRRQAGD